MKRCHAWMEGFGLDEIQAKAILDMQFRRLTGLEREKIENEYQDLLIKDCGFPRYSF